MDYNFLYINGRYVAVHYKFNMGYIAEKILLGKSDLIKYILYEDTVYIPRDISDSTKELLYTYVLSKIEDDKYFKICKYLDNNMLILSTNILIPLSTTNKSLIVHRLTRGMHYPGFMKYNNIFYSDKISPHIVKYLPRYIDDKKNNRDKLKMYNNMYCDYKIDIDDWMQINNRYGFPIFMHKHSNMMHIYKSIVNNNPGYVGYILIQNVYVPEYLSPVDKQLLVNKFIYNSIPKKKFK